MSQQEISSAKAVAAGAKPQKIVFRVNAVQVDVSKPEYFADTDVVSYETGLVVRTGEQFGIDISRDPKGWSGLRDPMEYEATPRSKMEILDSQGSEVDGVPLMTCGPGYLNGLHAGTRDAVADFLALELDELAINKSGRYRIDLTIEGVWTDGDREEVETLARFVSPIVDVFDHTNLC